MKKKIRLQAWSRFITGQLTFRLWGWLWQLWSQHNCAHNPKEKQFEFEFEVHRVSNSTRLQFRFPLMLTMLWFERVLTARNVYTVPLKLLWMRVVFVRVTKQKTALHKHERAKFKQTKLDKKQTSTARSQHLAVLQYESHVSDTDKTWAPRKHEASHAVRSQKSSYQWWHLRYQAEKN